MIINANTQRLPLADDSVDMVFTSPPYGDRRTYGIDFKLTGDAWVKWAVPIFLEHLRVCRGLVAWVVNGYQKDYLYHPLPEMLTTDLYRLGVNIRCRKIYQRDGIPGGSRDELALKHEIIVCASSRPGPLPWANPKAMGHPPKCRPGGAPSNRVKSGIRVRSSFKQPKFCKASNVINCGAVGGGNMGSKIAHEGEAPFPEHLVEYMARTFCVPGGIVLDPFCGSGTVGAVVKRLGRRSIMCDIRQSECEKSIRRVAEVDDGMAA
jgi:hypothetical protein